MAKRPPKVSQSIKALIEQSVKDDLIISPILDEFLMTWDETVSRKVAQTIADLLSTPPRNRAGSWSASGIGKPLRHQELQFLGIPKVGNTRPQLQTIFLNGRWVHLRWQAILLTAGLLDGIEVTIKKPSQRIRCTMDGVGTAKRGRFLGRSFGFELKGRNDFQFNTQTMKGVDEQTRAQVDFEFLLSGLDVFVIMNENKNNQGKKEWVFTREEGRIRDIQKRIKELNRAIDNQKLHPMPDECKKPNADCPWGGMNGPCLHAGSWPNMT